jgi:YidC/Oxa1 family membrane protein insertase
MPEKKNGAPKSKSSPGSPREISMEMRLLMAFALMGLVLLLWQHFFPPPAAPPPPKKAAAPAAAPAETAEKQEPPPPAAAKPSKKAASAVPAAPVSATKEETFVIETDFYRLAFSNRGATVRSWRLKNYRDHGKQPVELVSAAAAEKAGWPFSYLFHKEEEKPPADLNTALFQGRLVDPLTVEFTFGDGRVKARKVFKFERRSYRSSILSEVEAAGRGVPHLLSWRGGFGDPTVPNAATLQQAVYYDTADSKLVAESSKIADDGPVLFSGAYQFAGLQDTYFAALVLPGPGSRLDFQVWEDTFQPAPGQNETPHVGAAFGGRGSNSFHFFTGPKDTSVLRATDRKLEQLIDWGWFAFLAKPLFLALHWVNDNLTRNWGWAIVLVTVIINFLMLPLKYSTLRSMQKMAALKPEIEKINARYKGVGLRDAKKQKQNEELMALYQKHGINPMGGCIPLLLQMPFFIAFYKVLSVAIEIRGASWLWVADLSQPETIPIRLLPVGMLVSQVWMQKITPSTGGDPTQQRILMIVMPIMLTVMFYGASSGLVLYWLTGNVVGIIQQLFFNKFMPAAAPAKAGARK